LCRASPTRAARATSPRAQGAIFTADNESGKARTINVAGFPVVSDDNPFFRDLGANGRRAL
jgi:hypothetical protein